LPAGGTSYNRHVELCLITAAAIDRYERASFVDGKSNRNSSQSGQTTIYEIIKTETLFLRIIWNYVIRQHFEFFAYSKVQSMVIIGRVELSIDF
jgi:hypothetical protein